MFKKRSFYDVVKDLMKNEEAIEIKKNFDQYSATFIWNPKIFSVDFRYRMQQVS